jgi:cell division protease FtsH
VVGSLAYHHESEGELTYDRFRHDIRVSLGGRAAEEVLLGAEQVSRGASADLGACTRRSADAFGRYGFAPDMGAPGASAGNLAVLTGPPTASQTLYLEGLTRAFLAREYLAVLEILRKHRALLEAVADRMVWDAVVDQGELRAMCASLQIPLSRRTPE